MALCSCRVTFPAQSEESYQKSVSAIKKELSKEGFSLVRFQSQSGSTDNETYTFSNINNNTIEFTLAVERDSDPNGKYIKNVDMRGCTTSEIMDYDRMCSYDGIIATTLKNNTEQDVKGSRVDAVKTVGSIIFTDLFLGTVVALVLYHAL